MRKVDARPLHTGSWAVLGVGVVWADVQAAAVLRRCPRLTIHRVVRSGPRVQRSIAAEPFSARAALRVRPGPPYGLPSSVRAVTAVGMEEEPVGC
jgi:hypothetical protein